MPNYSIAIPTYNRFDKLKTTLEYIERLDKQPCQVIVINDGSTENKYSKFNDLKDQFKALTLILETVPNGGAARARNRAIELASADYILFLGDDIYPKSDLINEHAKIHALHPNVCVLGFTDWDRSKPINDVMQMIAPHGYQFNYAIKDHQNAGPEHFFTCNISCPLKVLKKHPFNTAYPGMGWEDIDLGFQLEKADVKIHYNPDALVFHDHYHDEKSFYRRQLQCGKNMRIFFRLNPDYPNKAPDPILISRTIPSLARKRLFYRCTFQRKKFLALHFELGWMKGYVEP